MGQIRVRNSTIGEHYIALLALGMSKVERMLQKQPWYASLASLKISFPVVPGEKAKNKIETVLEEVEEEISEEDAEKVREILEP